MLPADAVVDDPVPFASVGATVPTLLTKRMCSAANWHGCTVAARRPTMCSMRSGTGLPAPTWMSDSSKLQRHRSTRRHAPATIASIRAIADRAYGVEFSADTALSERVLWPATSAEAAGMEDARFVRFVDDDGAVTFYATYTAYSGSPDQPTASRDH